ncbi:MAG: hypothetical protein ACXVBW_14140 [Bdellovibrionota bacterium]
MARPAPAQAVDRRVKSFFFWSAIGLGAGTVVGFATLPAHQSLSGAFIGSGVGLFLGVVMGTYLAINIEQDPIFYPPESRNAPPQAVLPAQQYALVRPPAIAQFSYPVLRF